MDKLSNEREYILLCEGVRDALACASNGISNVVAVTNSDFPTSEQIEILRSYKNILVAFDNDTRGEKFADVCVNLLADTDFTITLLQYNGSDIRIALRDLTQRRLIINQIKTVLARIKE